MSRRRGQTYKPRTTWPTATSACGFPLWGPRAALVLAISQGAEGPGGSGSYPQGGLEVPVSLLHHPLCDYYFIAILIYLYVCAYFFFSPRFWIFIHLFHPPPPFYNLSPDLGFCPQWTVPSVDVSHLLIDCTNIHCSPWTHHQFFRSSRIPVACWLMSSNQFVWE